MKNPFHSFSQEQRLQQGITFLRLATGFFLFLEGYTKLHNPDFPATFPSMLQTWMAHNPFPLYRDFIERLILPNANYFASIVAWGETLLGISFISGFFIQLSAPIAIFMNLNYLLATQHTGSASFGINLAFILISLTLFWAQAGQYFGLDQLIFRPKGKKPSTAKASSRKPSPSAKKKTAPAKTKPDLSPKTKSTKEGKFKPTLNSD